jgi:hypothetical protein
MPKTKGKKKPLLEPEVTATDQEVSGELKLNLGKDTYILEFKLWKELKS